MRKAIGIVFVAWGAISLSICGIVLLRPPPIPVFLVHLGDVIIMIDSVQAPIWAVLFLASGIMLLLWKPKAARSK